MAKKEKIRKQTADERTIIECIKNYLNKYSAKSNLIRNIEYKEETNDDALRFTASIDYGSFEQRIVYYPVMMFREQFIDVEFLIGETNYVYTFYDIFNLFNISDFKLYFYDDLLSVDDVENALDEILNATEKYFADIERAGSDTYLPQLEKNYETDMNGAYGGDDWKDEDDDPFGFTLPFNHPFYPIADDENSEKTLKRLRKRKAKGKLDTIYEKRLLEYLESGKQIREEKLAEKKEFEKIYKRKKKATNLLIFVLTMAAVFALCFGLRAIIYAGAVTFKTQWEILGIPTTLPVDKIIFIFFTALFISIAITVPFLGNKLLVALIPENYRKKALAKYEKDKKDFFGNEGPIARIIGLVILVPVALIMIFSIAASGIGYYEDSVKFYNVSSFKLCRIPYEELEICKMQGYYENDEFINYENAYVLFNGDKAYEIGEVAPDGQTQQKLEEIAEKYNKEIKEINSIEDLYENSGN